VCVYKYEGGFFMKSFKITLIVALLAAFWMAGVAQAGQREGAFSLSPMIGYHGFEGDQKTDDGVFGGLSLGYNINKRWAAELEFRYTDTESEDQNPNQDIEIWSVGMNALYHFNPDGPFVPYVSAGFGVMYFDSGDLGTDDDYMMNWGVGGKYFFQDDLALRGDLRHVVDFHSDRAYDQGSGDDVDHNYLASIGLYWQFGGPALPPPPPADSDGDGIPDIRDKCPDTPLGVMVDAVGCPPVEKVVPPPPPPKPVAKKPAPAPVTKEIITFNLLFDFDKYQIKDEMIPILEQVKSILNEDPETAFMVMGHTCSMGSDEYNQRLSERRAASIKNWLVNSGIGEDRLESIGYGEAQPKYDNSTREGRAANRRVEIQTHEE
jgi:OOP family OmpA-OmpF porin